MTVLELSELLKGSSASASPRLHAAVAPPPGRWRRRGWRRGGKSSYDVVLTDAGDKKIGVIKEVG